MNTKPFWVLLATLLGSLPGGLALAEVCNLKVVTDASPDYSDLPGMIHSMTARWPTAGEKCWAVFYWNHIARRQTAPMILHGMALTDPIRQFNDYGYTMCSTISGINCGIWREMGLPARYWDISLHTVPEVFYDGRWHMYDNSMSALYTLCDGQTIAGVEDIGKEGACAASGGVSERGHVAQYHCLYSTGPKGYLTGADTQRSLDEEARCFNPNALKYRYYFFDWDYGHRYILNLRENETYTRSYQSLGKSADYYVPNNGKDPDDRYRIRGNGVWRFRPDLLSRDWAKAVHSAKNIMAGAEGLHPAKAGEPGEAVFKVQAANVITSQTIKARFTRKRGDDQARIAVSVNNGLSWTEVWKADAIGDLPAEIKLLQPVNGAYEALIKVTLAANAAAEDTALRELDIQTTTMLNAKTQPKLSLGRNTIYVGAGDQTESIVFWPELAGGRYKEQIVEEKNVVSTPTHPGYQGTIYPGAPGVDAWLVYRLDAPGDITRVNFGGRFYNHAPRSHIDLLYSLDGGTTWLRAWSLTRTTPPWDVIHYETFDVPKGHRAVWLKYLMNTTDPAPGGCSIYALRMEADHLPADTAFKPVQVTFNWSERRQDRSLVERSHTQTITKLPFKYTLNVAGADFPVMNSLRLNLQGALPDAKDGYSDGRDVGGEQFVPRWMTPGRNLALGRKYTLSVPSGDNWGAGDDGKKLTSGAGGPSYAGGTSYRAGAIWPQGANPVITLDLGAPASCASFGMSFHGYPWWDALQGEVQDRVEVLTSLDGREYASQGFLKTDLRWADLPVNFMWTDEETMTSGTFRRIPASPVTARYVKYQVTNKRFFDCAGLEVLDAIEFKPFDLRLALPDEAGPISSLAPPDDGSAGAGVPDTTPGGAGRQQQKRGETRDKARSETTGTRPTSGSPAAKTVMTSKPLGDPVLEAPTLHSLGAWWVISGDENKNAKVALDYRQAGATEWKKGRPLFRVEKGARRPIEGGSRVKFPDDAWLFAGSAVLLEPDTAYELRLTLSDPDGGTAEKILKARTTAEPVAPADAPQWHVAPGIGGGAGTGEDPFLGLPAAQSKARPGDIFLLHHGVYSGTFTITRNGRPGQPIIWRGAGDGETILDGEGTRGRVVDAGGAQDVWFEKLSIRHAEWGLVAHNAARLVIRRCHFSDVKNGLAATRNDQGALGGFFVSDNLFEGPLPWPNAVKGASVEEDRGIQISGSGQDICYNRVRGFKDGIDTFPSPVCAAIDIHHNEVSECLDDGCEMDYSERNTRLFLNRFTDVFQGISVQPVFGGPAYIFRNAVFNIDVEPVKMHNSPSGVLLFHNTFVKKGEPLLLMTSAPVSNCVSRNNLFIGTTGNYACEFDPPMSDCDFDYDGFGGGPWKLFLKWNGVRYKSMAEAKEKGAPVYRHALPVDAATVFASGLQPPEEWTRKFDCAVNDLRLKEGAAAIDAGEVLPGFNDGFTGKAPDLGAYEWGSPLPHYGPRPEK